MARISSKILTDAIRAPFRSFFGGAVAKTANAVNLPRWSADNGFEARWRNAANTDDVRALSVDAANNVLIAENVVGAVYKPITINIPRAGVNDAIDQTVFVVPAACRVVKITEWHGVAESTAATATCYIEKLTGTTAAGSGTSLMTGTFNLKATAATLQTATLVNTGTGDSDEPILQLAAGDRIGVNFVYTGTGITAADDLAQIQIMVWVAPAGDAIWVPVLNTATASCVDQHFFVADRDYIVTGIYYSHGVKSSNDPSKVMVRKCDGVNQAPASGTALLTNNTNTGFDAYGGVANTVQTGTLAASAATLRLAPGNSLALDYGTVTALKDVTVTVVLQARENLLAVSFNGLPDNSTYADNAFFTADRNYEIVGAAAMYTTADASGNVQLTRDTGTTAAGAGTDLLGNDTNAGWDTDAVAANAVNVGTFKDTRFNHLMAGDRLGVDFNGQDALVGFACTVTLKPE